MSLTPPHRAKHFSYPPPFSIDFITFCEDLVDCILEKWGRSPDPHSPIAYARPFFNIQTTGEISPAGPTPSLVVTGKIRKFPVVWPHWITFQVVKIS